MSICDKPFDNNFSRFSDISDAESYVDDYNNQCLLPKIDYVSDDIQKYMNQYTSQTNSLLNAQQTNIDTMNLYTTDYYYVMIKGIIYFIAIAIFIYFFGISNLINGIKTTGSVIKNKAITIKDKAIEIKDQIKIATDPKLS
jgi:hypothetical protein